MRILLVPSAVESSGDQVQTIRRRTRDITHLESFAERSQKKKPRAPRRLWPESVQDSQPIHAAPTKIKRSLLGEERRFPAYPTVRGARGLRPCPLALLG